MDINKEVRIGTSVEAKEVSLSHEQYFKKDKTKTSIYFLEIS